MILSKSRIKIGFSFTLIIPAVISFFEGAIIPSILGWEFGIEVTD